MFAAVFQRNFPAGRGVWQNRAEGIIRIFRNGLYKGKSEGKRRFLLFRILFIIGRGFQVGITVHIPGQVIRGKNIIRGKIHEHAFVIACQFLVLYIFRLTVPVKETGG